MPLIDLLDEDRIQRPLQVLGPALVRDAPVPRVVLEELFLLAPLRLDVQLALVGERVKIWWARPGQYYAGSVERYVAYDANLQQRLEAAYERDKEGACVEFSHNEVDYVIKFAEVVARDSATGCLGRR